MEISSLTKEVGVTVRPMQLVEIDTVCLQSPQRAVYCLNQLISRESGTTTQIMKLWIWPCSLRGEHIVIAKPSLLEPGANVFLGPTLSFSPGGNRVHLCRIQHVDASLERIGNLLVGFGLCVLLTPGHRA